MVKNHLPTQETQEMRVRFLAREGPLQKDMATHPRILAWELPWTEESGTILLDKESDMT